MRNLLLLDSTGVAEVDRIASSVIRLFETAFPNRIAGYFVEGSFASHTAVATSDLDLIIVFAAGFLSIEEQTQASAVCALCQAQSTLELDLLVIDEASLQRGADPLFILGTRCLYGRDIRAAMPLLSIDQWARQRMHAAYWLIINVFKRPHPVRLPVAYPHPHAPFYGYGQRLIRSPDGHEYPSTRDLVRVVGWAATARIALQARQYVTSKRRCGAMYRATINDEWSDLVENVFTLCRGQWRYHIPTKTHDIALLHTLCEQAVVFENAVLKIYRQFLIDELSGHDHAAQQAALTALHHTPFADATLLRLVETHRGQG